MQNFALNCQTCGGPLQYSPDGLTAVCPYCGNKYNFAGAKSEALTLALNRAGAMRIACDFDGAIREYKLITDRNPKDSEAWWGLALSKYGIEYVRDWRTGQLMPTCRRTVNQSILSDEYFLNAVKYARPEQAETYRARAAVIDRLQQQIKRRLEDEQPFDVFLSFRSSDENGSPTRERTVARRIYDELTRRGIKTFFSEVTLKSRVGEDFEPIIYKALYSCKFFILIAFSEENINTPWVKNEWSRFRDREEEEHLSGACCAVFTDITANDLPPFLRSRQGIDLRKYPAGGYETELADGIQSRFFSNRRQTASDIPNMAGRQSAPTAVSPERLLTRAWQDLNDGIYEGAHTKFLQAVDAAPESGEAWWGCFLAEHNAKTAGLAAQNITYEDVLGLKNDRCLRNAELYGDEELKAKVSSFRRMCAFRCNELAVESDTALGVAEQQLKTLQQERQKLVAQREREFKKLERARNTAMTGKRKFGLIMLGPALFFLIFFIIMSVVTEEKVLMFMGLFMTVMCAIAGVMTQVFTKQNAETATRQIPVMEASIKVFDSRLDKMSDEREKLEVQAAESRRRAAAFRDVFKN